MTGYFFAAREIDTAGDGMLAVFDGPARGIRCGLNIARLAPSLGLTSCGQHFHTGECEVIGDKLGGIAVHIGARVAALAGPGEVFVSHTVKDLVAGSGLQFASKGVHQLKGVPNEVMLFSVVGEGGDF